MTRIRKRGAHPTLNVSVREDGSSQVSRVVNNFAETFENPDESIESFGKIYRVDIEKEKDDEEEEGEEKVARRLDLIECWTLFTKLKSNFVTMYAAYFHFRDMGWVPKPGYSTGSDFVLYTKHPAYVHASFTVQIVDSSSDSYCWSWIQMASRVTHGIRKVTLMCEVDVPPERKGGDVLHRMKQCESKTHVKVITLRRALTEKEEEEEKDHIIVDGKKH